MATALECTMSGTEWNEIEDETCVKSPLLSNNCANSSNETFFPEDFDSEDNSILSLLPGKKFHLFPSFSSEDLTEVKDLCKELHERFGLKCVNYELDFVGGRPIEENIRICMNKSEKVLIILSPYYIRSPWCKGELAEALNLASKQNCCMIIPVILKPIDISNDLPSTLKPYRCIIKDSTPDIAAKIVEAYHSQAFDEDPVSTTEEDVRKQNGARLLIKKAFRLKPFLRKGFVYRFPPLNTEDKDALQSYDVKCTDQYEAVRHFVNQNGFIRRYKVFAGGRLPRCVATAVSLIVLLIVVSMFFLEVLIKENSSDLLSIGNAICAISLSSAAWAITLLTLRVTRLRFVKLLQKHIWMENRKYYEETKCLVVFDNSFLAEPSLCVIRYDTEPCHGYLCFILAKKFRKKGEDAKKHYIGQLMRCQLEDLQVKGQLTNWLSMPDISKDEYNRHNTWTRKQCLCQMLEKNGVLDL